MEEIYKDKELIVEGVNDIVDVVSRTFGPAGGTIGLTMFDGTPYVTKDGVSVANKTEFKNPFKNFAANLIKQAAQRTVDQAGDGTTTSMILAGAFFNKGLELGLHYKDMKDELNKLEDLVVEQLFLMSKNVNEEDIKDIALISSNGDAGMAYLIEQAYKHSDIVQIQQAPFKDDILSTVDGMRLEGTVFDKAFLNNQAKQAIDYEKCKFVIVDGKVHNIKMLLPYLEGEQLYPIVIMADHFPSEVVNILKREYNNGNIAVGLLKSPSFATNRKTLVEDIINYTDAKSSLKVPNTYYTYVDGIFADTEFITITKDGASVKYLDDLKEAYKSVDKTTAEASLLEKRINYLSGKLSIISAGGKSDIEKKEREDRLEDAVLAVKCALERGVVPGGGTALHNIYKTYKGKNKFIECINEPYKILKGRDKDFKVTKEIIDPLKVTQSALENAISVTKTLLTMEAVVLTPRLWS